MLFIPCSDVVPLLAWKGLHDSTDKQAMINEFLTQHRMARAQKASFKAGPDQSRQVPLRGWRGEDVTGPRPPTLSMTLCACQSRPMVRVFSPGPSPSFRSILQALTPNDARPANLDGNEPADEWKQKPQTAQGVRERAMVAGARRERSLSKKFLIDTGKTTRSQAPS